MLCGRFDVSKDWTQDKKLLAVVFTNKIGMEIKCCVVGLMFLMTGHETIIGRGIHR